MPIEELKSTRDESPTEAMARVLAQIRRGDDNLLELVLDTSKGDVGILMELGVDGDCLRVNHLTIYAVNDKQVQGITNSLFRARSAFSKAAAANGFQQMLISAKRVGGSSSGNPGKNVELRIQLSDEITDE